MIALGVLILVIVGLASLAVVFRGGDVVHVDLHWFTINASARIVFLAGAVALALAVFGLSLIWEGLKRARKRRKQTKELRHRAEAGEQLAARQQADSTGATTTGTAATGTTTPDATAPGRTERSGPDDHFDTTPRDR